MPIRSLRWGASDRLLLSGGGIVFVCLVVVLIYQVLLPFLLIIWTSLKVAHPGDPEFLELSFTTANYFRAFAIREFWEASLNTFYFASVSTLFSFVLGTFLAWTVVRTNTPLAQLIGMITLGAHYYPGSHHHDFLDPTGQPQHRDSELFYYRDHRSATVP